MAWDESGKQNQDENDRSRKDDPPSQKDFDALYKKLQSQFKNFFSGQKDDGESPKEKPAFWGILIFLCIAIAIWVFSGFFIVQPAEKAVVLRFGKYAKTVRPGFHWIPRVIDSVYIIDVNKAYNYSYEAQMLTGDENIISVGVTVFYRINNPQAYLFNVNNPIESLRQATASALRQVVGQSTLDDILTVGREKVREQIKIILVQILNRYHTGLEITNVALQQAKAPEEVKAAFDDAIKAQEDEKRYVNQAQAYARQVEPLAQGKAKRIVEEAGAYQQRVILRAKADTAQFLAILPEYQKAPQVTSERIYLDTMQKILTDSTKILVDLKNSNNLLYLPLDKILPQKQTAKIQQISTEQLQTEEGKGQEKQTSSRPSRFDVKQNGELY